MSDPPAVSLVCCDLASLVIDGSVVERAFAEAIATQGVVAGTQDYVRSMVRLDRARLVEFCGIDGDAKGGAGDRQLNIMFAECLAELGKGGFLADFTPQAEKALKLFADAGMNVVESTTPLEDWEGFPA